MTLQHFRQISRCVLPHNVSYYTTAEPQNGMDETANRHLTKERRGPGIPARKGKNVFCIFVVNFAKTWQKAKKIKRILPVKQKCFTALCGNKCPAPAGVLIRFGDFLGAGAGPICRAAKGSFPCGGTCRHMVFVVLFPTKRKNKVKSSARRQGKRCLPSAGRTCRKGTS